jgi:hypothetical protein
MMGRFPKRRPEIVYVVLIDDRQLSPSRLFQKPKPES